MPDTGNCCTCCRALVTRRSRGCCCYTPLPREPSLRCVRWHPGLTREFAVAHDAAVLDTFSALLCAEEPSSLPPAASRVAQLALRHGGLGLRSAALHAPAAFWASWADAFSVLSVREAPLLQGLAQALDSRNPLCRHSDSGPAQSPLTCSLRPASAPPFGLTCPSLPLCSQPTTLNRRSRCVAGSALLPESLTTLLSLNIVAVLALPSSHCWTHTVGPICSQDSHCTSYCS